MKVVNVVERNDVAKIISQIPNDFKFFENKKSANAESASVKFISRIPPEFFGLSDALAPREFAENSPQYLQIIPYVVFYCAETKEFLTYQRGKGSEEERLHSKYSLGFGGHIEIESSSWLSLKQVIAIETIREIREEIGYQIKDEESDSVFNALDRAAIIYDDSDSVGQVHLGINFIYAFKDKEEITQFELNVINNAKWMSFAELGELYREGKFESWSNLVIQSIIAYSAPKEVHAPEIPPAESEETPVSDTPADAVQAVETVQPE